MSDAQDRAQACTCPKRRGRRVHLVAHTHWDREWYSSFEVYRARLVDLMDRLLDILAGDPDYASFQLDGQTSMVEDYLEVRPERRGEIRHLVSQGRLIPGPWYTQPDEFLASGESLIRNLLRGTTMSRELGGVLPVGYLPDSFGHIAQMPQILRGFDIKWAFLSRGVRLESGDTLHRFFQWLSPDGSRVLTLTVGYGNGLPASRLPDTANEEAENIRRALDGWGSAKPQDGAVVVFHGCDHVVPMPGLPALVETTGGLLQGEVELMQSTLGAFFSEVAEDEIRNTVRGELRDKRTDILEGTLSTRMDVKMANARTGILLERISEPLACAAWIGGLSYPTALLRQAWKHVLQNHAHDSICCCGVDEVSSDVLQRFRWAREIGDSVVARSLAHLSTQNEAPACDGPEMWVDVYNTLGHNRSAVATATLSFCPEVNCSTLSMFGPDGDQVPIQLLDRSEKDAFVIRRHQTPRVVKVRQLRVAFPACRIPSMGRATFRVTAADHQGFCEPSVSSSAGSAPWARGRHLVATPPDRMENDFLAVRIDHDGTLAVRDKENGYEYEGLLCFEDSLEAGDVYNHVPPLADRVTTNLGQPVQVTLLVNGPLLATYRIDTSVPNVCKIRSYVTLSQLARRVDVVAEVENTSPDHRLRAIFPLGERAEYSISDGQFHVNERPIKHNGSSPEVNRKIADSHPLESFAAVQGGTRGLAVIASGLPEYEAVGIGEAGNARLALTLMRSVSKGPYNLPVPDARMLGTFRFEFAIHPHRPGQETWQLYRQALDHSVEMVTAQRGNARADSQAETIPTQCLFGIVPDDLILSAVKQAEDGGGVIVRLFNSRKSMVEGKLSFNSVQPREAFVVDLNEGNARPIGCIASEGIDFTADASGIVTLRLVF